MKPTLEQFILRRCKLWTTLNELVASSRLRKSLRPQILDDKLDEERLKILRKEMKRLVKEQKMARIGAKYRRSRS